MASTLIRIYDHLENAENARNELIHAGFQASRMHLSVRNDESGPVEGNFTVGNPTDSGNSEKGFKGFLKSMIDSPKEDYDNTYRHVVQRATYMLTVEAENEDEATTACQITSRHGALPTDNGSCDGKAS
jgi:hypothetical protein